MPILIKILKEAAENLEKSRQNPKPINSL